MKKIFSIILAFALCFCFVGCTPVERKETPRLAAPQNVKVKKIETSDIVAVTWDAVENATSYVVTVNDEPHTAVAEYYYIDLVGTLGEYTVTVSAKADGYADSEKSAAVTYKRQPINIGIRGGSEIRSGGTLQLESVVNGTADNKVTWEVVQGGDVISVGENGLVTAAEVSSDKIVAVKATSVFDKTVSETKALTVTAKPVLTQAMIDKLNDDYIGFEGFLTVNLYTLMTDRFYDSASYDISTSMNGNEWYAKYEVDVGQKSGMYVVNDGGTASQVMVSLTNEDDPVPMEDDDGNLITWTDGGMYNTFKGRNITLDAFTFNNETWRYEYRGMGLSEETRNADKKEFMSKIVSAANPYSFDPKSVALIIEDGEIAGIFATSNDDFSLYQNYVARMELTVALNIGQDHVTVPKVEKYKHESMHDPLVEAINNMRSLENYTTEYLNICRNYITSSYTYEGYIETVTEEVCNFRPYDFIPADTGDISIGDGMRRFTNLDYGYVNRTDGERGDFFNTYFIEQDSNGAPLETLGTGRAYAKSFDAAKPSFDFAAEIFTTRVTDEETGKMFYYVDSPMSSVASTFYRGLGTDMELYGIYATQGNTTGTSFTPYVVVDNGYIESAGFYYYLGYLIGVVEINYYDYNTTVTDEGMVAKLDSLEVREIPNSWSEFTVIDQLNDEVEVPADRYFKTFLEIDEIEPEAIVPVFNNALGDAFGFALASIRSTSDGTNRTIGFYYDVPVDIDYSLKSSLRAVKDFLVESGFTRSKNDVYFKTYTDKNGQTKRINIQPVDNQLDLYIYVWVTAVK